MLQLKMKPRNWSGSTETKECQGCLTETQIFHTTTSNILKKEHTPEVRASGGMEAPSMVMSSASDQSQMVQIPVKARAIHLQGASRRVLLLRGLQTATMRLKAPVSEDTYSGTRLRRKLIWDWHLQDLLQRSQVVVGQAVLEQEMLAADYLGILMTRSMKSQIISKGSLLLPKQRTAEFLHRSQRRLAIRLRPRSRHPFVQG